MIKMVCTFGIYIKDRETNKIAWFTKVRFDVEDIEQTKIDLMLDTADYDFEVVKVKLIQILYFV